MKPAFLIVSIVAAGLFTGVPGLAKTPSLSELPSGVIPSLPRLSDQPKAIDVSEHVDGLIVTFEDNFAHPMLRVFGEQGRCLRGMASDEHPLAGAETFTLITSKTLVSFVRSERVIAAPGGEAALEIIDAWIDPQSRGARTIARSTLPLRRVASARDVTNVYGVKVGDGVQVIVTTPLGSAFRGADGSLGNTSCAHARVALSAAPGTGEQAIVQMVGPASVFNQDAASSLRVTASLSQLSADPAPLFSVRIAGGFHDLSQPIQERPPMPARAFDDFEE